MSQQTTLLSSPPDANNVFRLSEASSWLFDKEFDESFAAICGSARASTFSFFCSILRRDKGAEGLDERTLILAVCPPWSAPWYFRVNGSRMWTMLLSAYRSQPASLETLYRHAECD